MRLREFLPQEEWEALRKREELASRLSALMSKRLTLVEVELDVITRNLSASLPIQ
jgi:hypothetical protein